MAPPMAKTDKAQARAREKILEDARFNCHQSPLPQQQKRIKTFFRREGEIRKEGDGATRFRDEQ